MSPIAEGATSLQLMTALHYPLVLVGGSYLGSISHTLTALEVLRSRGLRIVALLISQSRCPGAPDFDETVSEIQGLAGGGRMVLRAPLDDATNWAQPLLDAL
jgi:dethiobiotin synthetase